MCKKVDKKKGNDQQQQLLGALVTSLMGQIQQMKSQQMFQAGAMQGMQASMMQGRMGVGVGVNQLSVNQMNIGAGGMSMSSMNISAGGFPGFGSSGYFSSSFQSFGGSASMFGGVSAGFSSTAITRGLLYS